MKANIPWFNCLIKPAIQTFQKERGRGKRGSGIQSTFWPGYTQGLRSIQRRIDLSFCPKWNYKAWVIIPPEKYKLPLRTSLSQTEEKGEKSKGEPSCPAISDSIYLTVTGEGEEVLLMIFCPIWLRTRRRPNKQRAPSTKRSPLTAAAAVQKLTQFALWSWNAALGQVLYN